MNCNLVDCSCTVNVGFRKMQILFIVLNLMVNIRKIFNFEESRFTRVSIFLQYNKNISLKIIIHFHCLKASYQTFSSVIKASFPLIMRKTVMLVKAPCHPINLITPQTL